MSESKTRKPVRLNVLIRDTSSIKLMHNAAVVARMRIPQTDRFETTLPKEHFFNSLR